MMLKYNIYGTSKTAVQFLLEHPEIEVNCFIDAKNNSKSFLNYEVFNPEMAEKQLRDNYTLIATGSVDSYWQIKNYLETVLNLIEFEHFEHVDTYNKKISIIYGNCHSSAVKSALIQSAEFNNIYGCYPLKPICQMNSKESFNTKAFERCSLFIHQAIRKNNNYGEEYASENLLKRLPVDCIVIAMPNLYRMPLFMFPQMESYENQICYEGYNFFPYRDKFIDSNYNVKQIDQICKMIEEESLISHSEIRSNYEMFIEKVKSREKEWDISISNYLIKEMPNSQLFYDPNHPTEKVIGYIVDNILNKLGFNSMKNYISDCMDSSELPIYQSVNVALKLNWKKSIIRKYSKSKLNNNIMDLYEYVSQYIKWNYYR